MNSKNLIEGDFEGGPISNETLYQLVFENMTDEDQKEFKGKPLFWNNGLYIFPDGSIKNEGEVHPDDRNK